MRATVLLLGAVRLVWYCLSGFSVLPIYALNWRSELYILYSLYFQLLVVRVQLVLGSVIRHKYDDDLLTGRNI